MEIVVLILSVASCSMYDSYITLAEAIKSGDPLRIKCALSRSASYLPFCTVLSTREPR